MMILGQKREEMIGQLKLSQSLERLTAGERIHEELEYRCLPLRYSLEPEDFSPAGLDVVPLWESESAITGFYVDNDSKPVVVHYHVEDLEVYRVIGRSPADLVEFLVEEYVDQNHEDEVRALLLQ